jgi:hypothetical protein
MTEEQYIEHEVKLRVNDARFNGIEKEMASLNQKLNFIIITVITGVLMPVVLHHFNLL